MGREGKKGGGREDEREENVSVQQDGRRERERDQSGVREIG